MKIYIVEDHFVMRTMLKEFVEALPDLEVCGTAGSAEEALADPGKLEADLLLVDVSLPGMSGIDFVRELKTTQPSLPCLMLTGHEQPAYVDQALAAGAVGYVIKGDPVNLYGMLDRIRDGDFVLSNSAHVSST